MKPSAENHDSNVKSIVDYFTAGVKPSADKLGIELEHTLVRDDGTPVQYLDEDGQKKLLAKLSAQFDEEVYTSEGHLIGLVRDHENITLEPSSQLELSAGPYSDLNKAKQDFEDFEKMLEDALDGQNISVLTPGYHPTRRAVDLELLPKRRYIFMNEYLGSISMYGICMMRGSASTQVSIDYTSVEDCLRKLKVANACVPALALITDNSPIFEAEERPHQLMRTKIWEKCDPDRCLTVPGVMDDGFTLEDYAEYILRTPAIVAQIDGRDEFSEKTFDELFADKTMTKADVEHALSMFFTDVRLKQYVEIRPADAMPVECAIAYAALIKGIFYNEDSLAAAERIFAGVTAKDIAEAKTSLMKLGYNGSIYGHPAAEIADEVISIAAAGLDDDDIKLLQPLAELVANRTTLADIALQQ